MKASMEPLFSRYNVALALCGHVHAYERSHPVYKGQRSDTGTTYVNIGDGGNREDHASTWLTPPETSAYTNGDYYGHSRLAVANESYALLEWVPNDGSNWIVGDSVWIRNLN